MKGQKKNLSLRGQKVLLTGAGGFIGSHLAEKLVESGARVKALVHYNSRNDWGNLELLPKSVTREMEVLCGDIRDPFLMKDICKGCDAVFHLAALIGIPYSYVSPAEYVSTNVMGTLNILKAALDAGVKRFIHTSTSEVYGTAEYVPIDESHPLKGQSPYSASKIGGDKVAESFYYAFGLPVTIVRPFNTFGPRQSARAVIPTIITQAFSGRKVVELGSMHPIRDMNYVKDIAEGFIQACLSPACIGHTVNIGSGRGISVRDLAEKAIRLTGVPVKIRKDAVRVRPDASEVERLICDSRKAQKLIGWKPRYTLEEGLAETVEYFKRNISLYKPEIYNV